METISMKVYKKMIINIKCQNGHKYVVTYNEDSNAYYQDEWIIRDNKKNAILHEVLRQRLIDFAKNEFKKSQAPKKIVVYKSSKKTKKD